MKGEPIVILLVEDDDGHAALVRMNFEESKLANTLIRVCDGEQALDYLYRRNAFSDPAKSPRPGIVLLDLRMPKVDGLTVLKTIKSDANLARIPVVILTTSEVDMDIAKAYDFHANSYLVKPVDFSKFTELMKTMDFYWLAWNQRPR